MSHPSITHGFSVVRRWFNTATDWLTSNLWKWPHEINVSVIKEQEAPSIVDAPKDVAENKDKAINLGVTWEFRRDILDRLEEYFACMRRLRFHDPEAYETFKRIGFAVPDAFINPKKRAVLPQMQKKRTFGGILFPIVNFEEKDKDGIYPSFIYFRKLKCLANRVEVFKGDTYEVTVLIQERQRGADGAQWQFGKCSAIPTYYVGINVDGSVRLLKEKIAKRETIYLGRCRNGRRREPLHINTTTWCVPQWMKDFARDHNITPSEWAVHHFLLAYQTHDESTSKLLIKTERNGLAATFGIDIKRAPYFFRDRECEVNQNGRRKKIFHAVVQHARSLSDGKSVTVKSHYRGLRCFGWNGYGINIVSPDNAARLREFDPTGIEFNKDHRRTNEHVDQREVAKVLADVMNA